MASVFPRNFKWGAATASYQVEGSIENNDWAEAAREGRVPICGIAADHYHRYEEDFDIAQSLGHNAHRFSIEWARIEPEEGVFDEQAIEHYQKVLQALHERGLEPFVTLWHFTLPLWLSRKGGFENKESAHLFARYVGKVVSAFGEQCTFYSTMNEPNVFATHGYLYGAWPPFKRLRIGFKQVGKEDGSSERTNATARFRHLFSYIRVMRNLVDAHNQAYTVIKKIQPAAQVSVVKHVHIFDANEQWSNQIKARIAQYFQTDRFMKRVIKYSDMIAVNYYRSTRFGESRNFLFTDMGWKVLPSAIYDVLIYLRRYKKPIFIAEAGIADADDDLRPHYIMVQVKAVERALQDGVDVRGHMYWSLLDNYEWALGFEKRFGLVEIDYETLERKIRPSAYVYKDIIEQNGVVE